VLVQLQVVDIFCEDGNCLYVPLALKLVAEVLENEEGGAALVTKLLDSFKHSK
jgi:hypothetical protein